MTGIIRALKRIAPLGVVPCVTAEAMLSTPAVAIPQTGTVGAEEGEGWVGVLLVGGGGGWHRGPHGHTHHAHLALPVCRSHADGAPILLMADEMLLHLESLGTASSVIS